MYERVKSRGKVIGKGYLPYHQAEGVHHKRVVEKGLFRVASLFEKGRNYETGFIFRI